mmetsp:Transcript_499/g.493  ORF Transcript_499/g.493 Transcript_499/m.493 type:complete len:85 (+) Transcript_499:866-1120(+)
MVVGENACMRNVLRHLEAAQNFVCNMVEEEGAKLMAAERAPKAQLIFVSNTEDESQRNERNKPSGQTLVYANKSSSILRESDHY